MRSIHQLAFDLFPRFALGFRQPEERARILAGLPCLQWPDADGVSEVAEGL